MEIVAIVSMVLIIVAFFVGIVIGNKLSRHEEIRIPTPKAESIPLTKKHKEKKEMSLEMDKLNTILNNIDNYNGTAQGQKGVK